MSIELDFINTNEYEKKKKFFVQTVEKLDMYLKNAKNQ